jgi:SnoaL-like domain
MRRIDENYWKDYFDTHNDRRFDDLVNDFYTEDAVFENPKIQVMGRDQLISFLIQSNQEVWIELIPCAIITNTGVTAVELDCVIHAEKDLPDFLLGPMKKGGEAKMRMAAVYHLTQDRISRASIYWGRRVG